MQSNTRVYVIAEAGVNHNGSLDLAKRLVTTARMAGADAVKFQTFKAASLATAAAPKAGYQQKTTDQGESQLSMLSKLELSPSMHDELIEHAKAEGIEFLSTPFDESSLQLLTNQFKLRTIKIPSGEITNGPLLLSIARSAPSIILSTGMSGIGDVESALSVLAFGFTAPAEQMPNRASLEAAFASTAGQQALRDRVTLLHCTSEYPAPYADVNLSAMSTLRAAFGLRVGYSDHTQGIHVSIAAVALGACLIEKHFTLDRKLPGPDHLASLEPSELSDLVRCIRDVEQALGHGVKTATASEVGTRDVARKSLMAARPVVAGEIWTPDNLTCKRPGTGRSPMTYWELLGSPADRDYDTDEALP